MSSKGGKSKTQASEEDVDDADETASEPKWRTSLTKKLSRLGRRGSRPISWSVDNSRNYNDGTIGSSSQSLYSPCDVSPVHSHGGFDRSRKTRSFLFPSSSFREGKESTRMGFFRKMFASKKKDDNIEKSENEKNNTLKVTEMKKFDTLESILEGGSSSKGSVKSDVTGTNHIKNRFKKFVTKSSFGSGFVTMSTKFRGRLNSQDAEVNVKANQDSDKHKRSHSYSEFIEPSEPEKRRSSAECATKKDLDVLFENVRAYNGDTNSIRYIDSSSEEDIHSQLQEKNASVEESVRDGRTSIMFETEVKKEDLGTKMVNEQEIIKENAAFVNCMDKKPPDKTTKSFHNGVCVGFAKTSYIHQSGNEHLHFNVGGSVNNSFCNELIKAVPKNQYKNIHNNNVPGEACIITNATESTPSESPFFIQSSGPLSEHGELKSVASSKNANCSNDAGNCLADSVETNEVIIFSNVCLCDVDRPALCKIKYCRGNNIFTLSAINSCKGNECDMHYGIKSKIITQRSMSNTIDKLLLEIIIFQPNDEDIYREKRELLPLNSYQSLCKKFRNFHTNFEQILSEGQHGKHNFITCSFSEFSCIKLFDIQSSNVQNLSSNLVDNTNLFQFIAFNEQYCNELLKPKGALLKLYSLINECYDKNSNINTKNISDKVANPNIKVTLVENPKENVKKTIEPNLTQTQTEELEKKTEFANTRQEGLRKSKRKRKKRRGKHKQNGNLEISVNDGCVVSEKVLSSETSLLVQHSDMHTQDIEVAECFDAKDVSSSDGAHTEPSVVVHEEPKSYPISISHVPESRLSVVHFAKEVFEAVEYEVCNEDIAPIYYVRFCDIYQRNQPKYEASYVDSYEECKFLDMNCNDRLILSKTEVDKGAISSQISESHWEDHCTNHQCGCSKVRETRKLRRSKSLCQKYINCGCANDTVRRNWEQSYSAKVARPSKDVATSRLRIPRHRLSLEANVSDRRAAKNCDADSGVDTDGLKEVDKCPCFLRTENWPLRMLTELEDKFGGRGKDKSVRWLLSEAEEILASHQATESTLSGVSKQVDRFRDFFAFAKFECEKSVSLLPGEEHFDVCSEASDETHDLATSLRRHITTFADRLHLTKDTLEDTAKCYLLLDKAYEWALDAMKIVGRVKSSGTATLEQVSAAAEAIGELLQGNPPVSEETFTAMLDLATKLDNQTLLQQCKMAHARCKETISLLRNRQVALLKARHQMEFDCQSFVDLNEILSVPEESSYFPSSAWPSGISHSSTCRRRSLCSLNSRPRDPVSRCSSVETDDDSVFSAESPFSSTPSKTPLEGKSSLRGIKELRESDENLRGTTAFIRGNLNFFRSSIGSDMRISLNDSCSLSASPATINNLGSTVRAFSSGSSSSCSSSESSGPISGVKKDRSSLWRFTDLVPNNIEETNDLEEHTYITNISAGTNSHLLIRGSQINLSNSENLTQEEVRKNKTLLLIMQELIQTERDYVNSLEYIIENFIPELLREDIPQALRGQRNVIFGNIEKIFEFHSGYFLKELENCRNRPFAVGSIFLRYENQFYLYALYNKNKPKSDELMADFGTSFFKRKQMLLGDKMDLSSYLLKPVQRMGKYALLLKQLLKECEKSEEGYEELKSAQEMVQFQLRHGNDLLAMDSLRDCDVNLKEQGRLLRQGEFLVSEGSRGRKSLRHVFLFEELILFSKARKDPEKKNLDIFQYKQSLKTTDIGLTAQVGESPLRFEIWFRKRKPSDTFLFQSQSLEVKEAWTEEISKLLWRQALRNRKLRLHEMSSMGIGNKPCLDIRPSEDQISDRSVCISKAPPRLRLTTSASLTDAPSGVRRPHSVISVSSSASSAESSTNSSAGPSFVGTLNLGFDSGDSPKPLQRSVTRTSQCSAESGIITDIFPERETEENHVKVERSNSTVTNTSVDSALSPPIHLIHSPSAPLSALEEPSSTELPVDIGQSDQGEKALLTTEV